MRAWLAIVVAMFDAQDAFAHRPFEGTDAAVANVNEVELEIGPAQATWISGHVAYTPSLVMNYGLMKRLELVLEFDGELSTFNSVDSALLVKGIVREGSMQGAVGPSIALETGVLFPSIPRDGTTVGGIASLIVSQRWAPLAIHITATAAYERNRSFGAEASCIVEGPEAWRVRPVGEVFVSRDREYALAGAIWQHDDKQAFDVALVVERDAGANGAALRLGWTVAF